MSKRHFKMENVFVILFLGIFWGSFYNVASAQNCDTYTNCVSCTNRTSLDGFTCHWCPKEGRCRTSVSLNTACSSTEYIRRPSTCYNKTLGVYNPNSAFSNVLLSSAAYSDHPQECLDRIYPHSGFKLKDKTGQRCEILPGLRYKVCFAYTAVSEEMKIIVVAFRGTDAKNFSQLIDELITILTMPMRSFESVGKVQQYFANAYEKLFPCIKQSTQDLLHQFPDYDVVVTGHSLGGAIADLTAAALVLQGVVKSDKLSLYTFGSPRVGDRDYASNHSKFVKNSWRVVHYKDIVSHLPTCGIPCSKTGRGPYHHGVEIFYPTKAMSVNSTFINCTKGEDMNCSDGPFRKTWCIADFKDCIKYHTHYFEIPVGTICMGNGRARGAVYTKEQATNSLWKKLSSDKCSRIDP